MWLKIWHQRSLLQEISGDFGLMFDKMCRFWMACVDIWIPPLKRVLYHDCTPKDFCTTIMPSCMMVVQKSIKLRICDVLSKVTGVWHRNIARMQWNVRNSACTLPSESVTWWFMILLFTVNIYNSIIAAIMINNLNCIHLLISVFMSLAKLYSCHDQPPACRCVCMWGKQLGE